MCHNEQQNCCGTTCDKQAVSDYIADLEAKLAAIHNLTEPKTTHQLCDRVHTTRKLLDELIAHAPGRLYYDLNELSGGWMTPDEFKAKHGDVEL